MSVYKHQQGNYQSYRVARSVDGKLCQEYFPRTRQGLADAKKRDEELARDQERAQQFFTGPALRWQKKPKKVERRATGKAKSSKSGRANSQVKRSSSKKTATKTTARVSAKATPKRAASSKRTSSSRTVARSRSRKAKA